MFAALYTGFRLWRWREDHKAEEEKDMFALVEKVLALLHEKYLNKEGVSPTYLAIDHIRDQLIQPQDRDKSAKVWAKVVLYIRNKESRVREEVQHIQGEEFRSAHFCAILAN